MHKRVSITIIATRPRQFAAAIASALRKTSIDSFGGVPSDGVSPNDLISGLPVNLADPSGDPASGLAYALPAEVHFPTDVFLRTGDTIFEELALNGSVYEASLPVNFFRNVWFDGLAADRNDHYELSGTTIVPIAPLDGDISVSAKYVLGFI